MIEPNQNHVTRLMRRKLSFDEYQCRLVDKIKRHFEGRRRQWDKNVANWMRNRGTVGQLGPEEDEVDDEEVGDAITANQTITETPHIVTPAASPTTLTSSAQSSLSQDATDHPARRSAQTSLTCLSTSSSASDQKQQPTHQINILSIEATHFPDEQRTKHTILVDIQSFIKFGSVTVRQEAHGLTLIGQVSSQCNTCRSRNRRELARTYEKLVHLDAVIENDSMLVHTTREGVMRIDVVTILKESSS